MVWDACVHRGVLERNKLKACVYDLPRLNDRWATEPKWKTQISETRRWGEKQKQHSLQIHIQQLSPQK